MTVSSIKTLSLLVMVCVLALGSASVASAYSNQYWVSSDSYEALQKHFDDLDEALKALSADIVKAYSDQSEMEALIVHDRSGTNHWRLADKHRSGLKDLRTNFYSHLSKTFSANGIYCRPMSRTECINFYNKMGEAVGSLEGDWGDPDPVKNLGKALIKLNNVVAALKPMGPAIRAKLRSGRGGDYTCLRKEELIDIYAAMIAVTDYIDDPLTPAVTEDCRSAQTSGNNFKSIDYCRDGYNHWRIKNPHRDFLLGNVATAKPLATVVSHSGYPTALAPWTELENLCKNVMSDGGNPDRGSEAALQLRQKLATFKGNIQGQMAVFKQKVPNADEIIKEAEKKAAANKPNSTDDETITSTDPSETTTPVDTENGLLGETTDEVVSGESTVHTTSTTATVETSATGGVFADARTHTIVSGDELGKIAAEIRRQFIEAGWKEEDIPNIWAENGLVNALARANNMNANDTLFPGNELKIPSVPKADGGKTSYDDWFKGIGGESVVDETPVVDEPGSKPNGTEVQAMSAEKLKAGITGFMTRFFPKDKTSNLDAMHTHFKGKPAGVNIGTLKNNHDILKRVCEIIKIKVDENSKANGKEDAHLKHIRAATAKLETSLGSYNPNTYDGSNIQHRQALTAICQNTANLYKALDSPPAQEDIFAAFN